MTIPLQLHRAQPRRAQAHDGAHRRRHGARRLRVRDGADARGGARADAGRDRAGRQRGRHPPRARRPRCRAASTGVQAGDRREPARHRRSARDGQKLVSKEPVVLINLPKRDSGKPSNVVIRGVTPAGLALRPQVKLVEGRMFRPGTSEIIAGPLDRRRLPGRGHRRDAALRLARLDGRRRVRRRPHRLRLRDLGRRRADAAGVSPPRASRRSIFRLADTGRFDAVKARDRSRSAADARGQARDALLRRPVGGAVEVHQLPRHDDLGHLLDRRDHRRDDHDVRERRLAHRRDRHAARAGLSARGDPRRVPGRGAAARARRRRGRPRRRVVHAGARRSRRRTSRRSPSSRSRSR